MKQKIQKKNKNEERSKHSNKFIVAETHSDCGINVWVSFLFYLLFLFFFHSLLLIVPIPLWSRELFTAIGNIIDSHSV